MSLDFISYNLLSRVVFLLSISFIYIIFGFEPTVVCLLLIIINKMR